MDTVKLAQTSELVACRHSCRSSSSWSVRMVYHTTPNEDSCVGRRLLLYDWYWESQQVLSLHSSSSNPTN